MARNYDIPFAIEECIEKLDGMLSDEQKQAIRDTPEDKLSIFHFSLGAGIRNTFGLWEHDSPITKAYQSLFLISDADDASIFIIEIYWHRLNGIPFDLKKYLLNHSIDEEDNSSGPKPNK